jgi:hypothetical protein
MHTKWFQRAIGEGQGLTYGDRVGEVEILQDLRVFSCRADGEDLVVSLYGGTTCACGSVRWEGGMGRSRLRQLRRWRDEGTPVTYIRRGTTVTLVDEDALIRGALPEGLTIPPD